MATVVWIIKKTLEYDFLCPNTVCHVAKSCHDILKRGELSWMVLYRKQSIYIKMHQYTARNIQCVRRLQGNLAVLCSIVAGSFAFS